MSYEVLRTSTADEHIRGIAQYLSEVSGSSATALRFVSDLQDATQRLAEFPMLGSGKIDGVALKADALKRIKEG